MQFYTADLDEDGNLTVSGLPSPYFARLQTKM
jgi:hypothetical protein